MHRHRQSLNGKRLDIHFTIASGNLLQTHTDHHALVARVNGVEPTSAVSISTKPWNFVACYVMDEKRHLEGVVTVKELLMNAYETRLETIMDPCQVKERGMNPRILPAKEILHIKWILPIFGYYLVLS